MPWKKPNPTVGSLSAEQAVTDYADAVDVGGAIAPAGAITFRTEFVDEPFGSGYYDPLVFHRRHFEDNQYRVIVQNPSTDDHELHKTPDFSTYTLVEQDILPNQPTGSGYSLQDHVVLSDGTFAVYETQDEGGANEGTAVWTGPSLTNLSRVGKVISEVDCGVFYEAETDTVHIYPEDSGTASGVSSEKLSHWTTPATNLLNATQQSDAIDVSGFSWVTGDPDLVEIGGVYYMFMDNTASHPTYHIALARSRDLYNWELVNENITLTEKGGDIAVTRRGSYFEALTEYSGSDEAGIGHWRLYPAPVTDTLQLPNGKLLARDETTAKKRFRTRETSTGAYVIEVFPEGMDNFQPHSFRVLGNSGSETIRLGQYGGSGLVEAPSGGSFTLGVAGSGQAEAKVEGDRVTFGKLASLTPQASQPASPTEGDMAYSDGSWTTNPGPHYYDGVSWVEM